MNRTRCRWDAESGGSREHVLHRDVDGLYLKGHFGVDGRLKSIVKHRIFGIGYKKASIRSQDSARRQFQVGLRGDVGL